MHSLKTKEGEVIKPYVYQRSSFNLLVTALQKYHRALMVMATGLGKTLTSIWVLLHFLRQKDRVLFLCHDTGILDQAYKEYDEYLGDAYSCTKFYGEKKNWDADKHNIVFATFQSMASYLKDKRRKNIFSKTHFKYIIVDEGHHSKAETYAPVLEYFIAEWKMAMTATPEREDEENISEIFGEAVVRIELPEAIANGWLTPVDYRVLTDGITEERINQLVQEVLGENVRITEKQINERIFIKIRTQEQVKEILKESKDKQAIIFCKNITHLRHVAEHLPSSVQIHSDQSDDENKEAMRTFAAKEARHVLVVDKFNEGIDIPGVELIVFLRGTGSKRIFLQQLGRGLRKMLGKTKVTVLDFVGNIRRIQEIRELVERIEEEVARRKRKKRRKGFVPLHVEGTGFSFKFKNEAIDLLKVFERSQEGFYPTWQEASKAAVRLGMLTAELYRTRYREDSRLPSSPPNAYGISFPGWLVFLSKNNKCFYQTWEEASKAAIALGITSMREYGRDKKYKKDPKLPVLPQSYYQSFPGWDIFLGKNTRNFYATWQQASVAARKLGIKSSEDYAVKFKEYKKLDGKLHNRPSNLYKDFPGWNKFLKRESYKTWRQASRATLKLGINNYADYMKKHSVDIRLPHFPSTYYVDFPGWDKFFGKEK